MARIAGVNVPANKHTHVALRAIYGIGKTRALKICEAAGIKPDVQVKTLTEGELDQLRAVVHPTANPDESKTLSGAELVTLTATITDADGDVDTATVNIGQALVFKDDGPDINTNAAQIPTLTVDETVLTTNDSDNTTAISVRAMPAV